jgi:hypothetical protein
MKMANQSELHLMPVPNAFQMIGIVTERDYLRKIVHEGRTSHETAVEV